MPVDFTFVLACKVSATGTLFERVEQHLRSFGCNRDREIIVGKDAASDPDRAGADADQEVVLQVSDLAEERARLVGWNSIYMDFFSPAISLGVQFDLCAPGVANGYIFVNMHAMYTLHKAALPDRLYDMIGGIAQLAGATGGYGGFDAHHTPAPPAETLARLLANPADRSVWFDIHLVEASRLTNAAAEAAWTTDFVPIERRGFKFFVNRGFLKLCRELG